MLHVTNDTDDLVPLRIVRRERDTLADRISITPELARERTVHDRDGRRVRQITAREITTTQQRDLHRVEVARTHEPDLFVGTRVAGGNGLVLDREASIPATAAERQQVDRTDRFNLRSRRESIEKLLEKRVALFEVLVFRRGQCDAH